MTYGLIAKNDNSYVQIDSDTPRLCAIYSGVYSPSGRFAYVNFPAPITTPEPPCIFIQNSPARPNDLYDNATINGGPGNWTGFSLSVGNANHRPTGKWFAAVFGSKAVSDYGLRIWDAQGSVIYDSGSVPVVFTKASNYWSYQGMVVINETGQAYYWRNSITAPLLSDEYFMINPFSRGILQHHLNWMASGVRFNYAENCLQVYGVSALSPWADIGQMGAVFARLPGT